MPKMLAVNKAFRFAFLNQFNGSLNNSFFKTLPNLNTHFTFLFHSGVCLVSAFYWLGSLERLGKLSGMDKALRLHSFGFAFGSVCCGGRQRRMCAMWEAIKLQFFSCGGKKIKIRRVALSIKNGFRIWSESRPKSCFKVRLFDRSSVVIGFPVTV